MKKISFEHEHLDSYSGQNNYELGIYEDDNIIGYVQYTIYKNELTVNDIVVRPNRRREGFGSMLIKKMKQLHPEAQYQPSMKTDLGAKFIHKDVELNEQLKRIKSMMGINEALTDEVYHFTHLRTLHNILKTNQFITTAAVGTPSDMVLNKGRFFFFSTTRSKGTGYVTGHVKLVLDGRRLNQRYKGVAVDYWRYSKNRDDYETDLDYKNAISSSEMEDRIITNQPIIPNAISYIKEIHVLIGKYDKVRKNVLEYILTTAKNNNISIYFYNTKQNWLLQNKNNSVDPYQTYKEISDSENEHESNKINEFKYSYANPAILFAFNDRENYDEIISLIGPDKKDMFDELYKNEVYKHLQKNAIYSDETDFLYKNYIFSIRSDSNNLSRRILKLLSDDMRKLGVNNVMDYIKVKQEKTPLNI